MRRRMFSLSSCIATTCCIWQVSSAVRLASTTSLISSSSAGLGKVTYFYNDIYEVSLPENHRFPMAKYRLVREKLQQEFTSNNNVKFLESPMATEAELASTHCPHYIHRYLNGLLTPLEVRRTGFPWSLEHVRRSTSSVGGTVAAMRTLLRNQDMQFTGHLAGGTHHAFYDYGEGFCIFSDIAVAANLALREFPDIVQKVLIIDLDVHQGNGNAELFRDRNDVFTFSMQCKENYFSQRRTSNVDVDIDANAGDDQYLQELQRWLPYLLETQQPQLVFYQAGVDIFQQDKLGRLKITRDGLRKRNKMVFDYLKEHDIKCVVTMGGGYPKDLQPESAPFQELVDCHADVYRQCIYTAMQIPR